MNTNSDEPDDPKKAKGVGYKSPPQQSQFKKGKSGNPAGRPRMKRGKYTVADPDEVLAEVLAEQVTLTLDGQKKTVPKHKVVIAQCVNKAMSGDMAAIKLVIERYYRLSGQYKDPQMRFFRHTAEDEAREQEFRKHAEEFREEERKLREEAEKAGKPAPTSEEIIARLRSVFQ